MLDSARCDFPTEQTLLILKDRIIQTRPSDKFKELQESGQLLVCLFATRLACDQFNTEMLNSLSSPLHKIVCSDEVDESAGTQKWTKKA